MEFEEAAEQAAQAGDVQHESSFDLERDAAEQTEKKDETTAEEKKTDHEHAEKRKSDKEWQLSQEKAQKLDKLLTALGVTEEESKEKDPIELIQERLSKSESEVQSLREDGLKKDFEHQVPATVSEKYKEEWAKACKDKRDKEHKYHKLSYDEMWRIIKRDDPKVQQTKRELEKSESNPLYGSVPMSGTQVEDFGNTDLNDRTKALMIEELGYSEKDFK